MDSRISDYPKMTVPDNKHLWAQENCSWSRLTPAFFVVWRTSFFLCCWMLSRCANVFLPERDYVAFGSFLSQIRLSSVTFVRHTQEVETFGNIFSPFCTLAILWPLCKILRRSSQGNPPRCGRYLCHVRVSHHLKSFLSNRSARKVVDFARTLSLNSFLCII